MGQKHYSAFLRPYILLLARLKILPAQPMTSFMRILSNVTCTLPILLLWLTCALVSSPLHAAEAKARVEAEVTHESVVEDAARSVAETDPSRLWPPASAQHLLPFLKLAVAEALQDATCTEVMYARLNEYRTVYEEPTFTILCKKDYKTTFNKVYQVTELDPEYNNRIAQREVAAQNSVVLTDEIETLRQQLLTPVEPSAPTANVELLQPPQNEDPNDLSLDLQLYLDSDSSAQ